MHCANCKKVVFTSSCANLEANCTIKANGIQIEKFNPFHLSIFISNLELHTTFACLFLFLCVDPSVHNLFLTFKKLYQIPSLILVKRLHLFIYSILPFTTLKCVHNFFIVGCNVISNNRK